MSAQAQYILDRSAALKWCQMLARERARWLASLGLPATTLVPKIGTLYDRIELVPSARGMVLVGRWRDFIVALPSQRKQWFDRTDVIDRPTGPRHDSAACCLIRPWDDLP